MTGISHQAFCLAQSRSCNHLQLKNTIHEMSSLMRIPPPSCQHPTSRQHPPPRQHHHHHHPPHHHDQVLMIYILQGCDKENHSLVSTGRLRRVIINVIIIFVIVTVIINIIVSIVIITINVIVTCVSMEAVPEYMTSSLPFT